MGCTIEKMQADDWPWVRDIYGEGIATGNATFESEAPDWDHTGMATIWPIPVWWRAGSGK